ncbi:MAG: SurA N-terminal domain-containing protein [Pseudomonadota bacterium]
MLQNIREKFTGTFALVILGLLAIPFVFVGVGLNFNFIGGANIASANGEEIPLNAFEARYQQFVAQNPQILDAGEELRYQIRRQLLEQIIRETLIEEYLTDLGYRVTDSAVIETIRATPEFQVDGEFNMDLYRSVVGTEGYSTDQFELIQRRLIREGQMSLAIGASAVVTPAEYRNYINIVAQQRVVTTAVLSPELVNNSIEISDDDIVTFYDESPTLYQLPESANIEYALISRSAVAAGVEITESELQGYYDQESGRFLQDEQRQAHHILILFDDDEAAAEETATGILARVNAGEPFEDLARQYSMDGLTASNGGDLGASTRTQLSSELGTAIFDMTVGEIRGLVKSEFGFHIIRLDEILEQGPLPLEQVRASLLAELQDREADDAFLLAERAMSDALFDTPEMPAIAAAAGVDVQTIEGFTRVTGGGELGNNQAAIDAVFDPRVLEDGEISDVIELDAERSAVFRVAQFNEQERQPLDEVREQIETSLRAQRADDVLSARADEIVAAVESGQDFGEAASAVDVVVSQPSLIGRENRDVDPTVVVGAFTSVKPVEGGTPVIGKVRNMQGGYTVYTVDAVIEGRPESIPLEDRDVRKRQLAEQAGLGDYRAFVDALVESANVEIDEDMLAGDLLLP